MNHLVILPQTTRSIGVVLTVMFAGVMGCAGPSLPTASKPAAGDARVEDPEAEAIKMAFVQRYRGDCADALASATGSEPDRGRFRAWALLCQAWADRARAMDDAQAWVDARPEDPWARFAHTSLLSLDRETMGQAREEIETLPVEVDAADRLWLRTRVLLNTGDYQEAARGLRAQRELVDKRPELSALRIGVALRIASRIDDPERRAKLQAEALRDAERVQARWPELVEAYSQPVEGLKLAVPELMPVGMAEQLTRVAPNYARGRFLLWHMQLKTDQRPFADRKADLLLDIDRVADEHGADPDWLDHVAAGYQMLGATDMFSATQDRILREHPDSFSAEAVRYSRLLTAHQEIAALPPGEDRARRRKAWVGEVKAFLERPVVHRRELDGHVELWLFDHYAEDPTLSQKARKDRLLEVARGLEEHWRSNPSFVYFHVPRVLVQRADALDEALALARGGRAAMDAYEPTMRVALGPVELASWRAAVHSKAYETVGWVLYRHGEVADAVAELERAVGTDPENVAARIELGRILGERGDVDAAERYLLAGYARGNPEEREEAKTHLQRLFRASGARGDLDELLRARSRKAREQQKKKALATRRSGPTMAKLDDLRPLSGDPPLARLKGKVVVIEVWATWCGPCVRALLHFERAWKEDYREDPDVELLTLNVDDDPHLGRDFLRDQGHTVPACHDRGFARRMGVSSYPTTLFFDREGRLAFVKLAGEGLPADELAWRIDALR